MSMIQRRALRLVGAAAIVSVLWSGAAEAADLPYGAGGPPGYGRTVAAPGRYGVMQWTVRPQPRRFDIYGNPLGGFLDTGVPDPLVVNNGCPTAIEPVYDVAGNLAGYAPLLVCR